MNSGPNERLNGVFRRILPHLPQLAQGVKNKTLVGNGHPDNQLLLRPTGWCPICALAHRPRLKSPKAIVEVVACGACKRKLSEGQTAYICNIGEGQEVTWISSKDPELQGKALRLSHEQYDILKQHIGKTPTQKTAGEADAKNN